MPNIKFNCTKCGACCRKISDENSTSKGLPLFEWEVEKIKRLAQEKNIKIKIEPLDFALDKKSNSYFCTGYALTSEPCAFLKDNKCLIHKHRPLICKAFPIAKNPAFMKTVPDFSCFSQCCNFDFEKFISESLNLKKGKPYRTTQADIIKEYEKTFDEETMQASFTRDNILNYFDRLMNTLAEENLIDIEIAKEANTEPTPFLQFLVERKFITKKEKLDLIKKFPTQLHF